MTKQFKWEEKYSVKVPILDTQHQRFFDITNQILLTFDNPLTIELKERLTLLIVDLGNYALHHLDFEEHCMKSNRCPGCPEHSEVHDLYREKVRTFLQEVKNPDVDIVKLAKEVAEFSQNWLSKHILSKDKEYIGYLTSDNVT